MRGRGALDLGDIRNGPRFTLQYNRRSLQTTAAERLRRLVASTRETESFVWSAHDSVTASFTRAIAAKSLRPERLRKQADLNSNSHSSFLKSGFIRVFGFGLIEI